MNRDDTLAKLRAMFGNQLASDMPVGDPTRAQVESLTGHITQLVAYLAILFPNERINALMMQVWDLVGTATIPMAMGPVTTPSAVVLTQTGQQSMVILFPPTWVDDLHADPVMGLGSLIFTGSQAVDYYNDRVLAAPQECSMRARAYEVEMLNVIQTLMPEWEPNSLQVSLMEQYPEGLDSEGIVTYEMRETPHAAPPVPMAEA